MALEDKKKNILIINDLGINGSGGAENRVKTLINELQKRKYFNEIHLVHLDKYPQVSEDNIFFHPVSLNRYRTYLSILDIIEKYKIDIVQVHNLQAIYPVVVLAAKLRKKKVIWFVHDFWAICGLRTLVNPYKSKDGSICLKPGFFKCVRCLNLRGYIRQTISNFLIKKADACIVTADFSRKILIENNFLNTKLKIVYPWIRYEPETQLIKNIKREEFTILFLGSLAEYKGAWQIVKALSIILKVYPQTKLNVIGADQEKESFIRKKFEKLALEEKVLDKINFLGYKEKNDLILEFSKATVLVFPSDWFELFGQVWAEALFFECPVVASDIGGPGEFLKDFGILFPPKDFKKLAEGVIEVFDNKEIYFAKAKEARNFVLKNFNLQKSTDDIVKIYEEFL